MHFLNDLAELASYSPLKFLLLQDRSVKRSVELALAESNDRKLDPFIRNLILTGELLDSSPKFEEI